MTWRWRAWHSSLSSSRRAPGRCATPSAALAGPLRHRHRLRRGDHLQRDLADAGPGPDLLRQRRRPRPRPRDPGERHGQPGDARSASAPATVCAQTFADDFTCELTSTGVHTLRVDANGSGTGTFATTIERLNNPSTCPAIAFDPTGMTGAINQNAEIDCFARAGGAAGQRYQVRVVETSGAATLLFEVVRPDGTTVCGPTGSAEPPACSTPPAPTGSTSTPAAACRPPTTGSCSRTSPTPPGARRRLRHHRDGDDQRPG